MKNPKLSVLVPVCNVEKYLDQCLTSIVNQTFTDMEIIVINDGSTDNSLDIIKKFAAKDKRIQIIDKPNEGYGKSMNRGLDAARGKYIGIVESDDWIDPDMYETLVTIAEKNDLDVVKSDYFIYTTTGGDKSIKKNELRGQKCHKVFLPRKNIGVFFVTPSIWSAIYKREFLNKNQIRFVESPGASYQDTAFNFKVWFMADRAMLLDKAFLHYRCDNMNASVKSTGKVFCVADEWHDAENYLRERGLLTQNAEKLLARIKFNSYTWNLDRLTGDGHEQFLKLFRQEFLSYKDRKILDCQCFDYKYWNKLMRVLYPNSLAVRIRKAFFDLIRPIYLMRIQGNWRVHYLFGKIKIRQTHIPDFNLF